MSSPSKSWKENGENIFQPTRPAERNTEDDMTSKFNILEGRGDFALPPIRPGPIRSGRVRPKSTARELKRGNMSSFTLHASRKMSSENSSASLVGALYTYSSSEERSLDNPPGPQDRATPTYSKQKRPILAYVGIYGQVQNLPGYPETYMERGETSFEPITDIAGSE
ncbi:hypothetical protein D9619_010891 [Psilocybe cf. subviscida]|uniref:Uncharacterized protein n=1 Tax=Psilocybe cf. subviscida TaxID=2480587 RepID=A0A8H5B8E0_9AGAR|nr:hypothetical protein D9619_010891 [Psilocybe cf. subviscida]